jgi:hypothetical protein
VKVGRHVSPDSLVVGEVYFVAGYYDHERRVPFVQPLVFIGRNLARTNDDADRRWYFQDYESYRDGIGFRQDSSQVDDRTGSDFVVYPTDKDLSVYDLATVVGLLAQGLDESRGRPRDSGE